MPTKITLPGPFTMTQQARNDFYQDEAELAMDYAVAVNEELRALKACGVDVVQLDEPWVRTSPEKAARYGLRAINRALEGIEGPTVVHLCFGYAAVVANKPTGYSFLPQLADTIADQISIEAAQPKLGPRRAARPRRQKNHAGRYRSGRSGGRSQPKRSRTAFARH